jgi:hypothetical protein
MSQFGGLSKRHFTVVMDDKEHGLYVSSTPSSAAKKAVTKLCASNKSKKVEFCLREITQGSKKKTYGTYIGHIEKLKKPIELKGRVIKYKPVVKLSKKKSEMKGGGLKLGDFEVIDQNSKYKYIKNIFSPDQLFFGKKKDYEGKNYYSFVLFSDGEYNFFENRSEGNLGNIIEFKNIGNKELFNKQIFYKKTFQRIYDSLDDQKFIPSKDLKYKSDKFNELLEILTNLLINYDRNQEFILNNSIFLVNINYTDNDIELTFSFRGKEIIRKMSEIIKKEFYLLIDNNNNPMGNLQHLNETLIQKDQNSQYVLDDLKRLKNNVSQLLKSVIKIKILIANPGSYSDLLGLSNLSNQEFKELTKLMLKQTQYGRLKYIINTVKIKLKKNNNKNNNNNN